MGSSCMWIIIIIIILEKVLLVCFNLLYVVIFLFLGKDISSHVEITVLLLKRSWPLFGIFVISSRGPLVYIFIHPKFSGQVWVGHKCDLARPMDSPTWDNVWHFMDYVIYQMHYVVTDKFRFSSQKNDKYLLLTKFWVYTI